MNDDQFQKLIEALEKIEDEAGSIFFGVWIFGVLIFVALMRIAFSLH